MKKRMISLVVFLSMMISGCSADMPGKQDDHETVTIWAWDENFNIKAANMAAEEYKETHPGVEFHIQIREREEIFADIKNMLAAKTYVDLPDIIMIEDYDIKEMLALYEEEFYDFSDLVDDNRFVEYKTNLVTKNGRRYGVPFDSGTAALFYRLDILEQAGYSEQDMEHLTWQRFIEIGKDVYEKTKIPMLTVDPMDMPLVRIIMQSCGEWYVTQDDFVSIENNKALQEALRVTEQLLYTNVGKSACGWNEFISAFQTGKAASVISGAWIISSIKETEGQSGKWRAVPIPVLDTYEGSVPASNVGGSAWYVLKHAGQSEMAAEFVSEMFGNNEKFMDRLMQEIDMIPCVKFPESYVGFEKQDPYFGGQKVAKLLTKLANQIPTVNYGSNTYEIEGIVCDEFQNILVSREWKENMKKIQIKAEAVTRR